MDFLNRIVSALFALVRLVAHIAATLACGFWLGELLGEVFAHDPSGGSLAGLAVAGFLALGTFPDALTIRGAGEFLWWWFHRVFIAFIAIGAAVATYFVQVDFAVSFLQLDWDESLIRLASGALALLLWLPVAAAVLQILFSPAIRQWVEERILSGGISSPRDVEERARSIGASKPGRRP